MKIQTERQKFNVLIKLIQGNEIEDVASDFETTKKAISKASSDAFKEYKEHVKVNTELKSRIEECSTIKRMQKSSNFWVNQIRIYLLWKKETAIKEIEEQKRLQTLEVEQEKRRREEIIAKHLPIKVKQLIGREINNNLQERLETYKADKPSKSNTLTIGELLEAIKQFDGSDDLEISIRRDPIRPNNPFFSIEWPDSLYSSVDDVRNCLNELLKKKYHVINDYNNEVNEETNIGIKLPNGFVFKIEEVTKDRVIVLRKYLLY